MGLCRALVYVGAAAALGAPLEPALLLSGGRAAAYVAGLTYAAKQEALDRVASVGRSRCLAPLAAALACTASRHRVAAFAAACSRRALALSHCCAGADRATWRARSAC